MKRISVLLLFLTILTCAAFAGCTNDTTDAGATPSPNDSTTSSSNESTEDVNATPTSPPKEEEPVTITMMAVGDMLMHGSASFPAVQADGSFNYDYLFENVLDEINAADIAVVNQEVIFGGNEKGNIGYPSFNVRTEQGDALVKAGFDVVLHATNHTLDQGVAGIEHAVNFWKTNHPDTTVLGIHGDEDSYNNITIKEVNGIKLALLNYTYGLNGLSLPADKTYMVDLMTETYKSKIIADMAQAKELADFVVVFPHWGTEYVLTETTAEQEWAQFFADNGADLIIATHPHVIQPVKWVEGAGGNQTLVYYSLGNFVSIQYYNYNMLGGMAQVSITKDSTGTYISEYDMDFVVTHYTGGRVIATTYMLDDYTNELASQHAILVEPGPNYMAVNKNYPFTVEGLKALAEQVCPELADY